MTPSPQLQQQALAWDAHACFPLRPVPELAQLKHYKESGFNFVSINVGMDINPLADVVQIIAGFRHYIRAHADDYVLAEGVADIHAARAAHKLAVAFDLEGSEPLAGNVHMVEFFYDLGVRQMLLAYNQDNRAAGGCMEGDIGLTPYGRLLVQEMNRVGMVVDVTHMGHRATLETFEIASAPVIFSHANPKGVRDHVRNISDAQIKGCAQTGGVVGINGIGDFLGDTRSETVVAHIEYVMDLVGPAHIGLGLDYVVDKQEMLDFIRSDPERFPPNKIDDYLAFVAPSQLGEITDLLAQRGHNDAVIRGILGENFLRVAQQVWRT